LDRIVGSRFAAAEPDYRELLARKYLDGAAVRDLAAERGVSEKAIESKLVRAREKLRQTMLELVKREE
jgi:DNA-directed RNA polymerase specialized sigma24 family protein